MSRPQLPLEIVSKIFIHLPPVRCFLLCVQLRLTFCYHNCIPHITSMSMDNASKQGLVSLLDWWKQSGLPLKYTNSAMNWASLECQVAVLEWWKQSGLPLKYCDYAMDWASESDHVVVLDWWKQSGLSLRYSNYGFDMAHIQGNCALDWWKKSELEIKHGLCYRPTVGNGGFYDRLGQLTFISPRWHLQAGPAAILQ